MLLVSMVLVHWPVEGKYWEEGKAVGGVEEMTAVEGCVVSGDSGLEETLVDIEWESLTTLTF